MVQFSIFLYFNVGDFFLSSVISWQEFFLLDLSFQSLFFILTVSNLYHVNMINLYCEANGKIVGPSGI